MTVKPWHLLSLGASAIAILIGLHLLASLSGPSSSDAVDAIAAAKTWVDVAKGWHQTRIALKAREDAHADSARAAAARAAAHHAIDVALAGELVHAKTAADSNPILIRLVSAARAEASSWHDAFLALGRAKAASDSALAQADALLARGQAVTAAVTKVADCHLLGLGFLPRCPSRNASFVLGLGVGAIAVLAVHR